MRPSILASLAAVWLVCAGPLPPAAAESAPSDEESKPGLSLRYLGKNATHPGASVGLEGYLYDGPVTDLLLAPNVGWYVHTRNHHAGFVDLEFGGRWTVDSGFFVETFLGLGYMQRFPAGEVYSVDTRGEVHRRRNDGSGAALGSAMLGVGWDFAEIEAAPMNVHLRVGSLGEFPYNHTLLPHLVAQAGVTLRLGN